MIHLSKKAQKVQDDIAKGRTPDESYTNAMLKYYDYLTASEDLEENHLIAFEIYYDHFKKELFEGLVIGNADPYDVNQVFGIPEQSQEVYKELFFDTAAFRTKLDLLSYIENYEDKWGKEIKMRSYSFGPDFLYYTYAQVIPKSKSQHELVKRIFLTSAYKAMAINFTGPNSKINKEAMEFSKLMLKAYEALAKYQEDQADEDTDLLKVLVKREKALSPEYSEVDGEII